MNHRTTRRRFMYGVASVGGAMFTGPYILRAAEPNKDKLRVAFVATGGQAGAHIGLAQSESCPAYCDVDKKRWDKISQMAPNAKAYTNYREMLEKHEKEIDAVVVTTPDHNHACASYLALQMGKHVYTEKPLTWAINEARALAKITAEKKVATQMGNMGHANEGNRLVVEYVRGGYLGVIKEIHTWTNRPVWPQGIETRPASKPVPEGMDWDNWIGPAEYRDYHDGLSHFAWRGWFDFGCGAIGDMGCHTWDCVYWAMNPDYPTTTELVKIVGRTKETFPKQSVIKWTFPKKGDRAGFTAFWYEGGLKPAVPEEILKDPSRSNKQLPVSGSIFIGTKGKLLVQGDYGDSPRLIPESFQQEVKRPQKLLDRSPGHKQEWLMAAKGQKPWDFPGSNFATYAGNLTEVQLLGAIAIRLGEVGGKIETHPTERKVLTKEALPLVRRQYREGWQQVG